MRTRHLQPSILLALGGARPWRKPDPVALALGEADFRHTDPFLCFAEGDGDPDDDPDDDDKKFSQADVDRIVKRRLKKADAAHAKLQSQFEELQGQLAELQNQPDDDTDTNGDASKELTKLKRELARATGELKKLTEERDQAIEAATGATTRYKQHRIKNELQAALLKSGALPTAVDDAVAMMAAGADLEEDDEGGATIVVKVGDVPYEDPIKAAAKFLAEKPHYAKAPAGGGSGNPRGGGGRGGQPLDPEKTPSTALISQGLSAPVPGS